MSEHAADILAWVWVVVVALLTLLWWFFRAERAGIYKRLDSLGCRMDDMEKDMHNIRSNYLVKFDEVHSALKDLKEVLLERIHELELNIVAKHGTTTKRRSK